MELLLPFTPPYDWATTLRLVGAHTVRGAEVVDLAAGTITRLLPGPDGPQAITVAYADDGVRLTATGEDPTPYATVVRHWLDLDLDPADVGAAFAADPTLGPLVAARPGLRRVGYPVSFEAVVLTVLGQQVSLAAGRTFAARLVDAYGSPTTSGLVAFPTAEALAVLEPTVLQAAVGLTGARTRTVLAVARAFADDPELAVAGPQSPTERDAAAARLLALPGVGPWTADYLRMRLLADPDALPASDLVLRRALDGVSAAAVARRAEAWRPWRSYAVLHLWATMAW